jgi:hypothetical protein
MHNINPLKTQLNPICYMLALLGAHHILHVSMIRVNQISTKITAIEEIKLFSSDCTERFLCLDPSGRTVLRRVSIPKP